MKPRLMGLWSQSIAHSRPGASWAAQRFQPSTTPRQTSLQPQFHASSPVRAFSSTPSTQNWLFPKRGHKTKSRKGRPSTHTGGSVRGTTVVWGDYGIRMTDTARRISAKQLQVGVETIKKRLRGERYKLYTRVCANIGVYVSGNEVRMGKGKGSWDHWATRVAVSKILFEIKGEVHEKIIKDAFRLAAAKLPGQYEFVRKGDPPVMGITKMGPGVTREALFKPRMDVPVPSLASTADRLPESSPAP